MVWTLDDGYLPALESSIVDVHRGLVSMTDIRLVGLRGSQAHLRGKHAKTHEYDPRYLFGTGFYNDVG